jgi:hypothetical protein
MLALALTLALLAALGRLAAGRAPES